MGYIANVPAARVSVGSKEELGGARGDAADRAEIIRAMTCRQKLEIAAHIPVP